MEQDSVMSATSADANSAKASTQPEQERFERDVIIETSETLALRMLDAFWCLRNNSLIITRPDRMRAVLQLLADEVETWAPPLAESKICHLAVVGVAQRLREEAGR